MKKPKITVHFFFVGDVKNSPEGQRAQAGTTLQEPDGGPQQDDASQPGDPPGLRHLGPAGGVTG